jgi:hypothetical protein
MNRPFRATANDHNYSRHACAITDVASVDVNPPSNAAVDGPSPSPNCSSNDLNPEFADAATSPDAAFCHHSEPSGI